MPAALCMAYVSFKVLRLSCRVLSFIKAHFLQGTVDFPKRYAAQGIASNSYVVVTGATSEGIGFAFCEEWVDKGFNIALVGRSINKLNSVADKLETRMANLGSGAKVLKINADFGNVGAKEDQAVATIVDALKDKDVAGVVHGAGIETLSVPFTNNSLDFNRQAINVNGTAAVLLTQALLPQFTQRVERGAAPKSALVFVAAGLALREAPGANIYAASKSMENFFGQAVQIEFEKFLDVVVVHPLGVATSMMPEKPDGLMVITPQQCARSTLRQLGHSYSHGSWTNGWWFHEVQWGLMSNAPNFLWRKIWMEIVPAKMEQSKKEAAGYVPAP